MILVISYLSAYTLISVISIILVQTYRPKKVNEKERILLSELNVIIPFRNEAERIQPLIESIKNQNSLPARILFIDDHSSDGSKEYIETKLAEFAQVEIVSAHSEFHGKKANIKRGVELMNCKWVLTMDADIVFDKDYFDCLSEFSGADMLILPVHFKGKGFLHSYFSNDIVLSQFINRLAARLKRPIMASGANLLFRRDAYLEYHSTDHFSTLSGDDQFLLKDFIRNNKEVILVPEGPGVQVDSPNTFRELISQRSRWFGKVGEIQDKLANRLSVFFLLLILTGALVNILLLTSDIEKIAVLTIGFILVNWLLYFSFYQKLGYLGSLFWSPFYMMSVWLYALVIFIVNLKKPKWKGR